MKSTLEARIKSQPLNPVQKRAHITLLIQAGADTTGTALGSTLRFLLTHRACLARARAEIAAADAAGLLSSPVQYEETRAHLPYFVACIRESLRLNPPATNLFSRVVPQGGSEIGGVFVPQGAEVLSHAWTLNRDPELYAPDPETYRPERWLESAEKAAEFESGSFVFGMGPRVCLGKDISVMEMYKLLPEVSEQGLVGATWNELTDRPGIDREAIRYRAGIRGPLDYCRRHHVQLGSDGEAFC